MAGDRAASIGTRGVERFLRRFYALAGGSVAESVRGDVQPSIDVRAVDPWEWRDFGIIPWAVAFSAPAVAAQFTQWVLGPVGSNYDLVILGWNAQMSAGGYTVRLTGTPSGILYTTTIICTDNRQAAGFAAIVPVTNAGAGSNAAPGGTVVLTGASNINPSQHPIIMSGLGTSEFSLVSDTVNVTLLGSAWGVLVPIETSRI